MLEVSDEFKNFKFKMDYPYIKEIEKRISELGLAIKLVKKTTRLHQNKKKLSRLQSKLDRAIFNYNAPRLFPIFEKEMDRLITEQIENEFSQFADITDVLRDKSYKFETKDKI